MSIPGEAKKRRLSIGKYEKPIMLFFTIYAAIASTLAIYFQFFYKYSSLVVTAFDTSVAMDSTLYIGSSIVFTNEGNKYSTITYNHLVAYRKNPDPQIDTLTNKLEPSFRQTYFSKWPLPYQPIVLTPGQQEMKRIRHTLDAKSLTSLGNDFGIEKEIEIGISVGYINSHGQHTDQLIELGWIMLDKDYQIKKWRFLYPSIELEDNDEDTSEDYVSSPNIGEWQKVE